MSVTSHEHDVFCTVSECALGRAWTRECFETLERSVSILPPAPHLLCSNFRSHLISANESP